MKSLVVILMGLLSVAAIPKIFGESRKETITVMVIDTGIASHPKLNDWVDRDDSKNYKDEHGHGTHVTGIIIYGNKAYRKGKFIEDDKLCPEVRIISCKYYFNGDALGESVKCMKKAVELGVQYVNFSGGGKDFSDEEYQVYKQFSESGGTAVVAAGNESADLMYEKYYPASYAFVEGFDMRQRHALIPNTNQKKYVPLRIYPVQNVDRKGEMVPSSNYHPLAISEMGHSVFSTTRDGNYGFMTGTSQAAPQLLHLLLKQRCSEINK